MTGNMWGALFHAIYYGMTANLAWKGFDLSVFIQGVAGNDIYMQVNQDIEGFYRGFPVTQRYYDNRWTGEGSTDEYPRASWIGASNNKKAFYQVSRIRLLCKVEEFNARVQF